MKMMQVTVVTTYPVADNDGDAEAIYGTADPEKMAAIDQKNFDEDPAALFEVLDNHDYLVRVEMVERP